MGRRNEKPSPTPTPCPTCGNGADPQCSHAEGASSHYNPGLCNVAFVFSAPGAKEETQPVAGDTGINLDRALRVLHGEHPELFPHSNRYGYRITNAFDGRLAIALNTKTTEAKKTQILQAENIERVKRELRGMDLVVLCGKAARTLEHELRENWRVATACHVGNKGLNGTYMIDPAAYPDEKRRAVMRTEMWAVDLLTNLG